MAILLGSISVSYIVLMWPPEISFPWFLLPILAIGSIVLGFNYAYWLLNPREVSIEISKKAIRINDQPIFKWKDRIFDPKEIQMLHHSPESGTVIIDNCGKHHIVGGVIMMKSREIFKALREIHPHIKIKSDEIPNKSLESDA